MQQAIEEHSGGGQQQANRLVAAEKAMLLIAASLLLLLRAITLKSIVHALVPAEPASRQYSEGRDPQSEW
jgi:hypothetical protein